MEFTNGQRFYTPGIFARYISHRLSFCIIGGDRRDDRRVNPRESALLQVRGSISAGNLISQGYPREIFLGVSRYSWDHTWPILRKLELRRISLLAVDYRNLKDVRELKRNKLERRETREINETQGTRRAQAPCSLYVR